MNKLVLSSLLIGAMLAVPVPGLAGLGYTVHVDNFTDYDLLVQRDTSVSENYCTDFTTRGGVTPHSMASFFITTSDEGGCDYRTGNLGANTGIKWTLRDPRTGNTITQTSTVFDMTTNSGTKHCMSYSQMTGWSPDMGYVVTRSNSPQNQQKGYYTGAIFIHVCPKENPGPCNASAFDTNRTCD